MHVCVLSAFFVSLNVCVSESVCVLGQVRCTDVRVGSILFFFFSGKHVTPAPLRAD